MCGLAMSILLASLITVQGQAASDEATIANANVHGAIIESASVIQLDPNDYGSGNNWEGLGYAPTTGKLYGAPSRGTFVLVVDPTSNATGALGSFAATVSSVSKWAHFTYAPNTRKLYAAPCWANSMLIVDPLANATDGSTVGNFGTGSAARRSNGVKWFGTAYAFGKIYGAPYDANSVLILDTSTNVTDTTTLRTVTGHAGSWAGIAFSPVDGKLYAAPLQANAVLIVDPLLNQTDMTTLVVGCTSCNKWNGITFCSVTNRLYAAPSEANAVLIVDPIGRSVDVTTLGGLTSTASKWAGAAFGNSTGKLYFPPAVGSNAVLVVDPIANTSSFISTAGLGSTGVKWNGIVYASITGQLYAMPRIAQNILVVRFDINTSALPVTIAPTAVPTVLPTSTPSRSPTIFPTAIPASLGPAIDPTGAPTNSSSAVQTVAPSAAPTALPTTIPSVTLATPPGGGGNDNILAILLGVGVAIGILVVITIAIVRKYQSRARSKSQGPIVINQAHLNPAQLDGYDTVEPASAASRGDNADDTYGEPILASHSTTVHRSDGTSNAVDTAKSDTLDTELHFDAPSATRHTSEYNATPASQPPQQLELDQDRYVQQVSDRPSDAPFAPNDTYEYADPASEPSQQLELDQDLYVQQSSDVGLENFAGFEPEHS
eukprot:m.64353 g.64353  ORF g.64353 m.64353 type:complete len:660 (-) comp17876_c0_seq3:349-2328(-)